MKKINLLKISTCVIGLGMMLSGINSMAMEEKDIKVSEETEKVKQATSRTIFYRELSSGKGIKRKRICKDTRIKLAAAGVTRDEIRYIVKVDEELSGSKQYFPGFCESAPPTLYHACTDFMPIGLSVDKSLPKLNKNDLIEGSRDICLILKNRQN